MALTNAQMQAVINRGESVLYGYRTITDIASLPSDAQIAADAAANAASAPGSTISSLIATFDGGGSVITAPKLVYREVPYNCVINGWTVVADVSGSAVVDVKKAAYSGWPTTASIAGTAKPTLASARNAQDLAIAGWGTRQVNGGDILEFNLNSVATITFLQVFLRVSRS